MTEGGSGDFAVRLICCDRDAGYQVCADADAAHQFRDEWVMSGESDAASGWRHDRVGVVVRCAPQPLGWAGWIRRLDERERTEP
jgi:hypothetical protein